MKKYLITIFLILIIGFTYIVYDNRVTSTITLDINPSIEINLNKKEQVKSVKALNEDAKEIVSNNLKGKTLSDTIEVITVNVINNGYADEDRVFILLYTKGEVNTGKVVDTINADFDKKNIHTELVIVESVTEEDIKLAKEYNISPAKVSYIESITKDKNITLDNLVNKSINDIVEAKIRGKYCDDGYFIEGDFCYKEIDRRESLNGYVCPKGYYEYEGTCYEESNYIETDELVCMDEFTLVDDKCYRKMVHDAMPVKYSCNHGIEKTKGELGLTNREAGDAEEIVCVDLSSATHPVSPCELPSDDPTERMSYGGKCYWHRAPVIAEGCPGKINVNGMCWDDASNILICAGYRDGKQYKSRNDYCEHSIKYFDPVVSEYKCDGDFNLNGTKCEKEEYEDAFYKRVCMEGYTLLENDRCINKSKIIDKVDGFICNMENAKLKDNMCIIYDIKEALQG